MNITSTNTVYRKDFSPAIIGEYCIHVLQRKGAEKEFLSTPTPAAIVLQDSPSVTSKTLLEQGCESGEKERGNSKTVCVKGIMLVGVERIQL